MTYIPTVTDLSDIRERAALGIGHLSVTDVVVLCAEVERLRAELAQARDNYNQGALANIRRRNQAAADGLSLTATQMRLPFDAPG